MMKLIKKPFWLHFLSDLSLKLNRVRVVQCDLFDLAGLKTTWMIVKKSMRMKLRKKSWNWNKKGMEKWGDWIEKKELLCWYEQWSSIKNLTFFSIKGNAFSIKHNTNIYIYLVGYKSSVDKIVNPCNAMHLDRFFFM
jgi:hypothetical protein